LSGELAKFVIADLPDAGRGFRMTLRDLGYIEGQTLVFEDRAAESKSERFPALALELVALKPHHRRRFNACSPRRDTCNGNDLCNSRTNLSW